MTVPFIVFVKTKRSNTFPRYSSSKIYSLSKTKVTGLYEKRFGSRKTNKWPNV